MAYEAQGLDVTMSVGADFSTSQYAFVMAASSAANLVLFPSSAGAKVLGVIQDPASSGAAKIRILGVTKVLGTSAVGIGDVVSATTLGRASGTATNAAQYQPGTVIAAASTGNSNPQVVTLVLQHLIRSS